MWVEKVARHKVFAVFSVTQAKNIFVKFCHFVANLYPHILTSFGRFILIFSKIALIFLWVYHHFYCLKFWVSPSPIAVTLLSVMIIGPQFTRPQSTGLSGFEAMLELQPKPKWVPEFKDALQLIWSALVEKAIDNDVKDYHKRLQACVSQRWTF